MGGGRAWAESQEGTHTAAFAEALLWRNICGAKLGHTVHALEELELLPKMPEEMGVSNLFFP